MDYSHTALKMNKLQLYITRMDITNIFLKKPETQENNQYESFTNKVKNKTVKTKLWCLEMYDQG